MEAIPLKAFLDLLGRGLVSPRPVARRLIDGRLDMRQRLTLVALAAALQGVLWAVIGLVAPGVSPGGLGIAGHAALAGLVFVNYAIVATLAFHIGRRFGGRGSPADVATAVGWHSMLTAALTPVQAIALGGSGPAQAMSGGAVAVLMAYIGYNIWLLAACVAEAHGFASTRRVALVTVALFFALGLVLSLLFGGLGRG
jgi:hypothetical protein